MTDPLEVLAQVQAWRQIADLGGFPHHPTWDQMETAAREQLRAQRPGADTTTVDIRDQPPAADPFLLLAQVKASRIAADLAGVVHDPSWDDAEAAAVEAFHEEGTS